MTNNKKLEILQVLSPSSKVSPEVCIIHLYTLLDGTNNCSLFIDFMFLYQLNELFKVNN